jgi:Saccharopine dehydrogenase NADP binding domain
MSEGATNSKYSSASSGQVVAVFGASGHTGRFVVSELQRRGWTVIAVGRDPQKLQALGNAHGDPQPRVASIGDPKSLDEALAGAVAVINCAGPFLDTAAPVISAALRARIHYIDVAAEQVATLAAFEQFSKLAQDSNVLVLPSVAFYGALGDLLATAAMGDWASADEIRIAVGLDSWKPTRGTRLTGQRNTYRRYVVSDSKLEFLADPAPRERWNFPLPFGAQEVIGLPLAETIVISRHLRVPEVRTFMNLVPLQDLHDPSTPEPTAVDESGRSAQKFVMDVVARKGEITRRAIASGRDIYAVTAPLVAEALERILSNPRKISGTVAPGQVLDAKDFLKALTPIHLLVDFQ